jgi:hypothetical protein
MKTKKPFLDTTVGKILKFVVGAIIKNQKGIKNTPNADKVDKVIDSI